MSTSYSARFFAEAPPPDGSNNLSKVHIRLAVECYAFRTPPSSFLATIICVTFFLPNTMAKRSYSLHLLSSNAAKVQKFTTFLCRKRLHMTSTHNSYKRERKLLVAFADKRL